MRAIVHASFYLTQCFERRTGFPSQRVRLFHSAKWAFRQDLPSKELLGRLRFGFCAPGCGFFDNVHNGLRFRYVDGVAASDLFNR